MWRQVRRIYLSGAPHLLPVTWPDESLLRGGGGDGEGGGGGRE